MGSRRQATYSGCGPTGKRDYAFGNTGGHNEPRREHAVLSIDGDRAHLKTRCHRPDRMAMQVRNARNLQLGTQGGASGEILTRICPFL